MAGDDWWQRVWNALQSDSDLSEEATKQRIIEPTLMYLGWDLHGTEVQREYPVDAKGRNEKVDYGLLTDHRAVILIEAKKLRSPLGDKDARQVLGYARLEGIRYCVLTNGRKWKLYNAEWSKEPDEASVREWELTEGPAFPEAIKILSKAAVVGGDLDKAAGESRENQRLLQALNKILPELEEEMLRNAKNRVYALVRDKLPGMTRSSADNFVRKRLQVSLRGGEPPAKPQSVSYVKVQRAEGPGKRSLGLWPVPGGVHRYVESAVSMLDHVAEVSPSMDEMIAWMKTRFERVHSDNTIRGYVNVLRMLGLLRVDGGRIELTPPGEQCLRGDSSGVIAAQLRTRVAGVEEILAALRNGPLTSSQVHSLLLKELGVEWKTPTQTEFRLLWMENVGLIGKDGNRYRLEQA